MKTLLYEVYPVVPSEFTFPLTPEPVPLKAACKILQSQMQVLGIQGFWRNTRGERIPLNEVGFKIVPENSKEEMDMAGQCKGDWHP
jgi:hypothetical protein